MILPVRDFLGYRRKEVATRHDEGATPRETGNPNISQRVRILGLSL